MSTSTSISTYLNNVPTNAPEYPLVQAILSKISIAANTVNGTMALSAQQEIPNLLNQLVESLMALQRITPATILALAANAASQGGYIVPDVGVLGYVQTASPISLNVGAY